ncbi:hypothetical protein PR003_g32708 [Phytophthora rubi]|uniref:Reverse transcriptase domain-containing protein n=1 Tax=Phytophthora rubi TaxID=129364 RepID=A0A6A4B364_9STRA|nr:hypothetical protein PR003_g32708 [Phytophthora rubi]
MIHPNQNGFVPFRTIHATVDLFTAAQAAAKSDPDMAEALALLLDFRKAYDSVDREFLYAVLDWLGFPPEGALLFLLVLEALYRRIDSDRNIEGVMLRSKAGVFQLKVGGYADDTASYVRRAAEVIIILAITRVFAQASGLTLNEKKTLVVALNPVEATKRTGRRVHVAVGTYAIDNAARTRRPEDNDG